MSPVTSEFSRLWSMIYFTPDPGQLRMLRRCQDSPQSPVLMPHARCLVTGQVSIDRDGSWIIRLWIVYNITKDIRLIDHLFSSLLMILIKIINPIGAWGGWISPHYFQRSISPWKRVLEVPNFVTFPNSLWTFRKSKKFGFSQWFEVIEKVRADSSPPLSSNIQEPCSITVKE